MRKEKQNVSSEPLTEREKQLMKEIAELKEANEILKDAMSFFVKDWRFVQYYNRTRICTFNEGGYPPVVYREKVAADELKAVAQNKFQVFQDCTIIDNSIHFAFDTTNMGYDLCSKQKDFEELLFSSIKSGQILKLSRRDWNARELKQDVVLPLLLVMHEGFSGLLFCLKFSVFSNELKSISMNLNQFELIPFNDITAINQFKNEQAKTVCIKNKITFPGNTAAYSTSEPRNFGYSEKKGVALNFTLQFPDLPDKEPYEVMIHFEINDSFEYVVTENLLDGAYHESEKPWRKPIEDIPIAKELSDELLI